MTGLLWCIQMNDSRLWDILRNIPRPEAVIAGEEGVIYIQYKNIEITLINGRDIMTIFSFAQKMHLELQTQFVDELIKKINDLVVAQLG